MSKGGKTTKVNQTTAPDAASQAYIEQMRKQSQDASNLAINGPEGGGNWFTGPLTQTPGQMAEPFMNPYMTNVVDGVRGEFDHLRAQANMGANQQATQAGAFGGSRHGVMAGARLGELDRAQGSTIANLLHGGYQNALSQGTQFAQYQQVEATETVESITALVEEAYQTCKAMQREVGQVDAGVRRLNRTVQQFKRVAARISDAAEAHKSPPVAPDAMPSL